MFLLPPHLRKLFEKKKGSAVRVFQAEEDLSLSIIEIARQQSRSEEDVLLDFAKAGRDQYLQRNESQAHWDSLTDREQEVAALSCLGRRNYEIAEILGIAPETVKSHLQNIFAKFNLHSRNELRLVLQDWPFEEWWQSRQR